MRWKMILYDTPWQRMITQLYVWYTIFRRRARSFYEDMSSVSIDNMIITQNNDGIYSFKKYLKTFFLNFTIILQITERTTA